MEKREKQYLAEYNYIRNVIVIILFMPEYTLRANNNYPESWSFLSSNETDHV